MIRARRDGRGSGGDHRDPSHAIVELANERKSDLIVLGAHEGGLVSRVIEGSVGDAVAHAAHTDVLIVH